jgi:hypothetical protein
MLIMISMEQSKQALTGLFAGMCVADAGDRFFRLAISRA